MVYCSIEEAWGMDFNDSKNNKPDIKVDPEFLNLDSNDSEYSSVDFTGKSFNNKNNTNRKFSRNMSRLSNHNGQVNRYTSHNNVKKLNFVNNINSDKHPEKKTVIDSPPSYLNLDTPINEYNFNLQNKMLKKQMHTDSFDFSEIIEEAEDDNCNIYSENNDNVNNSPQDSDVESDSDTDSDDEIDLSKNNLKKSKNRSKKTIDQKINNLFTSNSEDDKNNIYEIGVYIITGIFIIFILDIFTKLGKNSR